MVGRGGSNMLIVIDPGHGGYDPGAVGVVTEKDVTIRLGLAIRDKALSKGIQVIMTRESDRYVSLNERVGTALLWRPDAFLSLHVNSSPNLSATGFEVWYQETDNSSWQYAAILGRYIRETIPNLRYRGVLPGSERTRTNWYTFSAGRQPNDVLLELGFINNQSDMDIVLNNITRISSAIVNATLDIGGVDMQYVQELEAKIISLQNRIEDLLAELRSVTLNRDGIVAQAEYEKRVANLKATMLEDWGYKHGLTQAQAQQFLEEAIRQTPKPGETR
jgi:hypothetical protein